MAFATEAFTLLGIGLFVIALRLYVRISTAGFKHLYVDDYLMVLAAVVYSAETYLAFTVGARWKGLANNAMTDEERRLLDPNSEEYHLRVSGSKTQVAGMCSYTLLLWIIKAAVCTFYLRLTAGLGYRKRVYVGFALIIMTWVSVLLTILLSCRPLSKSWQIYPDPGSLCQPATSKVDILVTLVLNVVTDIYLICIPVPLLWKSSLRPLKKAGLIILFSGGLFVTVAGVLRCVLILSDPVHGAEKAGSWAVRETFVAVVTSNLPIISPLIARAFRPIIGTVRFLSSAAPKTSGNTPSGGDGKARSYAIEDKTPRRGTGPRTINPIPDFTLNGSDEHICPPEHDEWGTGSFETDVEAGRGSVKNGGILKRSSIEIIEMRNMGEPTDGQDITDYYMLRGEQGGIGGVEGRVSAEPPRTRAKGTMG